MEIGLEKFLRKEYKKYQKQRLGILCNQASVTQDLLHIRDAITEKKSKLSISCFFGPQHGIRGEKQDNMIESEDMVDPIHQVPVFSLYSDTREPTEKMFSSIDTLLVDLQDLGTRIYTFMYTMANCMRAAKKWGKKVVILDRPNPIDGIHTEGNVLEKGFTSFVGQFPICVRHGMTMGELALLFNEEFGIACDLEIIRLTGWRRNLFLDEKVQDWVPPSPNIPRFLSALVFPGTVLFEGTNVSEGRGTTKPFEWIGAPYIEADLLAKEMNAFRLPGVYFRPIFFQPTYHKGKDQVCGGVHIHVKNPIQFNSYRVGLFLLATIAKLYPKDFQWKEPPYEYEWKGMPIDFIAGTDKLRKAVDSGTAISSFEEGYQEELSVFRKIRKEYLLYRTNLD